MSSLLFHSRVDPQSSKVKASESLTVSWGYYNHLAQYFVYSLRPEAFLLSMLYIMTPLCLLLVPDIRTVTGEVLV